MILITSAKYVNPELQAEFGKIPPSFLPLGGKRLYEYQAKLFETQEEKTILSLPQSFLLPESDKKKLQKLNITVLMVPDNLSLGESVIYSINMNLPINDTLKILHGDTYFEYLEERPNAISSSLVNSSYAWTYLLKNGKAFIMTTKESNNDIQDHILSGYFSIANPYEFIQAIVETEYSFINGLARYSIAYPFEVMKNRSWLDFGLVSNYFHSKKVITTERDFNSLVIKDGFVTKSSTLEGKLEGEIHWFTHFPKALSLNTPRFFTVKEGYAYKTEYLYTNTLAELYVFGHLPLHVWQKIFKALKKFLGTLHTYTTEDKTINFDYLKKTHMRLAQFTKERQINLDKAWVFNTQAMPSIHGIIRELNPYIHQDVQNFVFIHGDFCFSNIMYDFKSNEIKTFDPRGIDFDNKTTVYGDADYDFAKLMHSVVGLYDYIISGFYHCKIEAHTITFHIEISEEIQEIQEAFFEVFDIRKYKVIYAITIHLFISMLPLHAEDEAKQNALLANIFRLYASFQKSIRDEENTMYLEVS